MWQNIVPMTVFQRALRVLLGSLFLAVAWVCASAVSSVASDLSSLVSDTTRIVQDQEPALVEPGESLAGTVLDRTVEPLTVEPRAVEPLTVEPRAVADVTATVTGLAGQSVTRASSVADSSLAAVETTTRNLTSTAPSVTPRAVQPLAEPVAAVVDSVVNDTATAVKPVLTKAASLPARIVNGVVPGAVTVTALPAVPAKPAVEPAAGSSGNVAPASRPAFGAEREPGVESSGLRFPGTPLVGIPAPFASGQPSGMAGPDPSNRPDSPSLPLSPPAGAAGGANSGGTPTPQLAGTFDTFAVPFNAASELRTRSSGPDPQALNRHPGFSPD